MNKYHQEILAEIKKQAEEENRLLEKNQRVWGEKYIGTKRLSYQLTQPRMKMIAKNWCLKHQNISFAEFILLLNSLYQGQSHNERVFGGILLEYLPGLRKQINPNLIDRWLTGAEGWSEVDSLCQTPFGSREMLDNWEEWERLLEESNSDPDIHKRRASLVLLTKPVRESEDPRFTKMAFGNIEKLKGEKDILITKAISWLLRDLIKNHRNQVVDYLNRNSSTLPKIATRETRRKLITGKK